jgi:hypothetical protein
MTTPNRIIKRRNRGPITTKTQSVSFDLEVYEIMESDRCSGRRPVPRSVYIREVLEAHFRKKGLMKSR